MEVKNERISKLIKWSVLGLLILIAVLIVWQYIMIGQLSAQKSALSLEYNNLQENLVDAENEYDNFDYEQTLEDEAKENLNMQKDGETVIIGG